MSQLFETPTRQFQAAAAIAIHLRVKLNGSNKLAVCGAGATEYEVGTMTRAATAADQIVAVRVPTAQGTTKMVAAGAFSQEAMLYAAASGKVDDVVNGKPIGIALGAANANNDIVEVMRVNAMVSLAAASALDDVDVAFGTGTDVRLLWSTGDASNHTFVIALDNTGQQMHITDVGAKATDWARAAGTHPELAIHSNTTPITDYLAIGNHDGTTATIDVVGGTTLNLDIAGTTAVAIDAGGITLADDIDYVIGTGNDAALRFSTGDASNHATVLALDNTSQHFHITDLGAIATDWNLGAGTHPTVFIHSNTTPATDYVSIGGHDGTTATVDVVGGTTLSFAIAGTAEAGVNAQGLFAGTFVVASGTAGTDQLTLQSTGTAPVNTGANVGHLYADYETDDDEVFWLSGTGGTATQLTT